MRKNGDLIRAIDLEGIPSGAKRLGVTRQRVHQMIDEGKLDYYEFGKRRLVHKRDIDKLIYQRQRKRAS
jgi:excisionase family DNA binding protein